MYTGNWYELSDTQKDENGNYYINISFHTFKYFTLMSHKLLPTCVLHAFLPYVITRIILYLTTTKIKHNIHE